VRVHPRRVWSVIALILAATIVAASADTLTLRDGGLLEGRYAGGTGDVVQFTVGGQARYFPVSTIAQLIVSPRGSDTGAAGEAPALPDPIAAGDAVTLRLRDGSVFKGAYRGGTGSQAYFQVFGEVQSFTMAQVAAIEFVPPPPIPAPAASGQPAASGSGQTSTTTPPAAPKKLFFGGGIGFGYGDISWLEVWPVVGYRLSKSVTTGVEFLYRVREDDRYAEDLNASDYGVSPFLRLNLMRGIFVQAEYEYVSYEYLDTGLSTQRDDYDSLLLGVGFSRPMGGHAAFVVSTFYNFSYSDNDLYGPYDSPWIVNAGVGFGF